MSLTGSCLNISPPATGNFGKIVEFLVEGGFLEEAPQWRAGGEFIDRPTSAPCSAS